MEFQGILGLEAGGGEDAEGFENGYGAASVVVCSGGAPGACAADRVDVCSDNDFQRLDFER